MSGQMIVVADLALDREIMSIRTWWTQDPRIAGTPLSVFLYFRGLGTGAEVTQAEAMAALGLGKAAFRTAKERLRDAGFLIEIRDRFPAGYRDPLSDEPRGGLPRYRLLFLDPAPDSEVDAAESLIEADEPVDISPGQNWGRKSAPVTSAGAGNRQQSGKPQMGPGAGNRHQLSTGAGIRPPYRKTQGGLVNRLVGSSISEPTNQTGSTRETQDPSVVDAELEAIAPGARLSVAAITAEVAGRVDLSQVDLVAAVRDTVCRAKSPVANPASYVASVIVRKPDAWLVGSTSGGWTPQREPEDAWHPAEARDAGQAASCLAGNHDWGSHALPDILRAHCVHCGEPRRKVDPDFARHEAQHELEQAGAR
ncbi:MULTISPECIES: hypothetical protein [unclassified Leucobacter]|uniref:hypothetical protein n=3 Tax=Leucobacter TaxID=55968 RepID=UPI003015B8D7